MLTPGRVNWRIRLNSTRVSRSESDAVGSSMISRRQSCESARAMPTICRWATDSSPTGRARVERVRLAEPLEQRARLAAHRARSSSKPAELSRLAADENVVEGAEVRERDRFLVDDGDAGGFAARARRRAAAARR